MADQSLFNAARRWADVPKLDPETERAAAEATVAFLKAVEAEVTGHLGKVETEGKDAEELHVVWDFEAFDPRHLDFLLATLGEGDVRIKLCEGEVKVADTGVPGLWRMQSGRDGQVNSFILARIPKAVRAVASEGKGAVPAIVNGGANVFAAPAILNELQHTLETTDLETLTDTPAFMVELTHQPMSPGDMNALYSTLGRGPVEVELRGMAIGKVNLTGVRGIWHSQILNTLGKTLLDAYVVAGIPPEVPLSESEWVDCLSTCADLIAWVEHDIERGTLGGKPAQTQTVVS